MAYTDKKKKEIFDKVIERISEKGEALRVILSEKGMPSTQTFYIWLEENTTTDENGVEIPSEESKLYTRACDIRTETKFQSIEEDYSETPQRDEATGKIDPAWVQLQRLKIDSKKWELSKLMPKKYGDKSSIELDGNLNSTITIDFTD